MDMGPWDRSKSAHIRFRDPAAILLGRLMPLWAFLKAPIGGPACGR